MTRRPGSRWDDDYYEPSRPSRWPAVAVFFGVLLCLAAGGGFLTLSGYGPFASSPEQETASEPVAKTATELMGEAECGDAQLLETPQPESSQTGTCTLTDGAQVTIATFDSPEARDQWIQAARDNQLPGALVSGEGWAALVNPATAAEAFATKLAGEIV